MSAQCEDFPCCGHEQGACPDEEGRIPCCECGRLMETPIRSSICERCLNGFHEANEDPTGQDLDEYLGDY